MRNDMLSTSLFDYDNHQQKSNFEKYLNVIQRKASLNMRFFDFDQNEQTISQIMMSLFTLLMKISLVHKR